MQSNSKADGFKLGFFHQFSGVRSELLTKREARRAQKVKVVEEMQL